MNDFTEAEILALKANAGSTFVRQNADRGPAGLSKFVEDAPTGYTPTLRDLNAAERDQAQSKMTPEAYATWAAAKAAADLALRGSLQGNRQQLVTGARFRNSTGEIAFDSNTRIKGPSQDVILKQAKAALEFEEKLDAEKRKEAEAKAALAPEALAARLAYQERQLKRMEQKLTQALKALEAR